MRAKAKRSAALLLALALLLLCACAQSAEEAPLDEPPREEPPAAEPTPTVAPACAHPQWIDGVCALCGAVCPHSWQGGVCTVCGVRCPHPRHDPESFACLSCGEKAAHLYSGGCCLRCGESPPFFTDELPERFFSPSPEQGSVEAIDFRTAEDPKDQKAHSKRALVYLPFGYDAADAEARYNVVIGLHGAGDDEHGMMDEVHVPNGGGNTCFRLIYDRMLCERLCEPFIFVSVNVYSLVEEDSFTDYGVGKLTERLEKLILPYLAEHYRTYAADGSPEALREARAHFGLIGLSNGSLYALSAGMANHLELFGNFACFSGNYPETAAAVIRRLNASDSGELPVYCFFTGAGTKDFQRENTQKRFEMILENCPSLAEGENAFHLDVEGTHNWRMWGVETYNALLVMFQNRL